MARHYLIISTATLALAACSWVAKKEADKGDVLGGSKTTVVYATTQCTVPNADGVRCDRKTCKEDAASNCASFKDRCTQYGHSYEGNDSSGTCIRGDQVG